MAKIALAAVGGIIGGVFGGPFGMMEGISIGLSVGSLLFPPHFTTPLQNTQVSASAPGAPIPFGYGTMRFGTQIIWTPGITFTNQTQSAKGGPTITTHSYFASFAAAIGEGPCSVRRIWGDSKLIFDANPNDTTDLPVGSYPLWSATQLYNPGNMVNYAGKIYTALLTGTGQIPSTPSSIYWMPAGTFAPWLSTTQYFPGDVVSYGNLVWVARVANINIRPGSDSSGFIGHLTGGSWDTLSHYYPQPVIYPGDEFQLPDALIQASEGVAITPAFRGLSYFRYEKFPLANFGNRIPNIRAEVSFLRVSTLV
jgi:hypothetical protein